MLASLTYAYRFTLALPYCCGLAVCMLIGCHTAAPIHVWKPPQVDVPRAAKIALAPVAGDREISQRIETAMLAQRPAACADLAIFTAEQLVECSPIRLVSTAALNSDLTALHAARAAGADLLLQGEILATDITLNDLLSADEQKAKQQNSNMNNMFFKRLMQSDSDLVAHRILLSWRVIDVASSKTIGSQAFTLHSQTAALEYPDLAVAEQNAAGLLIAASARQTWRSIAPVVSKEEVRLTIPWAQPGAWLVRRGVRAAKKGQWPEAEALWQKAADRYWFSAPAHHNLAIAMAAREDFASAKRELRRAHSVLNFRLPQETLFWLDQQHRSYHQAHGFAAPTEGWAFPDASEFVVTERDAPPIDLDALPWWTAIPLMPIPK
jgi:tetratricopeptide (TPR) repeat protein